MPKTPTGRKADDEKKTVNVSVWLSIKERRVMDAAAQADGDQSAGAWLRRVGLREARKVKA